MVVGAVHEKVYPAICYLSDREDRDFLLCSNYFHNQKIFSADRLGLKEDFCIPLTAAVVELAALDMRTTPLDRLVNKKLHWKPNINSGIKYLLCNKKYLLFQDDLYLRHR